MTPQIDLSDKSIIGLKKFLKQNTGIDFRIFNFLDEDIISTLNWSGFENNKKELTEILKGYQRLIRIMPNEKEDTAFLLLKSGLHSALQICSMSRKDYMKKISENINGDFQTAEQIYANALEKRGVVLLQYMNILQNNEPHISAARFS